MTDEKNELISIENGLPTLNKQVETIIDNYEDAKTKVNELEKNVRASILNAMIDNSIYQAKVGKYTISQVIPKNTIVFDTGKFLLNESTDIANAFTEVKETEELDIDTFKLEQPEMYKKYCTVPCESIETHRIEI